MKPIVTEKAIMRIEANNSLTFQTSKKMTKPEIKKEVEEMFNVKVKKIRTQVKDNKRYAYVQLKPENLAIDVATKLGVM